MKLINILSIVCLLFIAASCSMEDDLLDRVDTPDNNKEKNEAYAYADFEFSLATSSNVQTRSSSATSDGTSDPNAETTEASVSSCYIAVINESGDVIASDFYSTYNSGDFGGKIEGAQTIKKHMTIKVHKGETSTLKFFAIANLAAHIETVGGKTVAKTDQDGFMNCKTFTEIQNHLISSSYINIFVKQGFYETTIDKLILREDLATHSNEKCTPIRIPVEQVTSAVLLKEFSIRDEKGSVKVVTNERVKSVQLINLKNKTYLNTKIMVGDDDPNFDTVKPCKLGDDYTFNGKYKNPDYFPEYKNPKYETIDQIRFYTYRNETEREDRKTALKIVYTLEDSGAEYTKVINIKSPSGSDYTEKVEAGKLYQLYVTVSNSSSDEVNYVVEDWIPNTIDLGTINGTTVQ